MGAGHKALSDPADSHDSTSEYATSDEEEVSNSSHQTKKHKARRKGNEAVKRAFESLSEFLTGFTKRKRRPVRRYVLHRSTSQTMAFIGAAFHRLV